MSDLSVVETKKNKFAIFYQSCIKKILI